MAPTPLPTSRDTATGRTTAGIYLLAVGQTVCWTGLYYSFAALLLAWEHELGWSKTDLTLGLTLAVLVAALAAPLAGRITDADGGRWMLTLGALGGAIALVALSGVTTQTGFLAAWAFIGLTQGFCLYEACFAFMTRALGAAAPAAILRLTLVAGFASPLSFISGASIASTYGWQYAVTAYAAAIVVIGAPLHYLGAYLLESDRSAENYPHENAMIKRRTAKTALSVALRKPSFWLLALAFPLIALNHGILLNHLIPLLVERGISGTVAVAAASVIGPMQVVGRLLVFRFEGRTTMLRLTYISVGGLIAASCMLLFAGADTALVIAFAATQGAAYGLVSILRPTVIAESLGRTGFGSIAGWLAVPYLAGFAFAPYVGALLWTLGGYDLAVFTALSCGIIGLVAFYLLKISQGPRPEVGDGET